MKKIGACLLLIGSFLVLSLFTGCQARTVTVDTVLTVDSSWSGSRVMTVAFSAADYPDEQSRAALDGMMARCPSAMTYGKQEKDSQIQYIFTLEFTSHEDYQKKLEALMGSAPYGVFSHTDSIFSRVPGFTRTLTAPLCLPGCLRNRRRSRGFPFSAEKRQWSWTAKPCPRPAGSP